MPIRRRQTGPTDSLSLINTDLHRLKGKSRTPDKTFPRPPASKVDAHKCSADSFMTTHMESSNWNHKQNYSNGTSSGLLHENSQWDQWSWGLGYSNQTIAYREVALVNGATSDSYPDKNYFNSNFNYNNGSTVNATFNQGYCEHSGASVSEVSQFDGIYYYHCFNCGNSGYYNQSGNVQYDEATKSFQPVTEVLDKDNWANGASIEFCENKNTESSNHAVTDVSNRDNSSIPDTSVEVFKTGALENEVGQHNQSYLQPFHIVTEDVYSNLPQQTVPSLISNYVDLPSALDSNAEITTRASSELEKTQMASTASVQSLDCGEKEENISFSQDQGQNKSVTNLVTHFNQQWYPYFNEWDGDFETEEVSRGTQNNVKDESMLTSPIDQRATQHPYFSNCKTTQNKEASTETFQLNYVPNGTYVEETSTPYNRLPCDSWNNDMTSVQNEIAAENSLLLISSEHNEEISSDTKQMSHSIEVTNENTGTLMTGPGGHYWADEDWNWWANNLKVTTENGLLESVHTNDLSAVENDQTAQSSLVCSKESENCEENGNIDFTAVESDGSSVDQNVDEREISEVRTEIVASGWQNVTDVPVELTVHDCIGMYVECLQSCRTVTDVFNERIWHPNECPVSQIETGFENETVEVASIQDQVDSWASKNVDHLHGGNLSCEMEENEDIGSQNCETLVEETVNVEVYEDKHSNEAWLSSDVKSFQELNETMEDGVKYENDNETAVYDNQRWDAFQWNEDFETEVFALEVQEVLTFVKEDENAFASGATEISSVLDEVSNQNFSGCLNTSEKQPEEIEGTVTESFEIDTQGFSEPAGRQHGWDATWNEQFEKNDWEDSWNKAHERITSTTIANQNEKPIFPVVFSEGTSNAIVKENRMKSADPERNTFKEIDFDYLEENNNWNYSERNNMPVYDEETNNSVEGCENEAELLAAEVTKVGDPIFEEQPVAEESKKTRNEFGTSRGGWNNEGWGCSFENSSLKNDEDMEAVSEKQENYSDAIEEMGMNSIKVQYATQVPIEPVQSGEEPKLNDEVCADETREVEKEPEVRAHGNDHIDLEITQESQTEEMIQKTFTFDDEKPEADQNGWECSDGNKGKTENQWDENECGWGWDNYETETFQFPDKEEAESEKNSSPQMQVGEAVNFDESFRFGKELTESNNFLNENRETEDVSVGLVEPVTPPTNTMAEMKEADRNTKLVPSAVETVKLIDVKSLKVSPSYALRKTGGNSRGKNLSTGSTDDPGLGKLDLNNVSNLQNIPVATETEVPRSKSPEICSAVPVLDHRTAANGKLSSFSLSLNSATERSKLSKAAKVDILPDRAKLNPSVAVSAAAVNEPKSLLGVSMHEETREETTLNGHVEKSFENHNIHNSHLIKCDSLGRNNHFYPDYSSEKTLVTDGQNFQENGSTNTEGNVVAEEFSKENLEELLTNAQNISVNNSAHTLSSGQGGYGENNTPPGNESFTSESTIHSVPNLNGSLPLYHHPQVAPINVDPNYNKIIRSMNAYSTPEANQTSLVMSSYPMVPPFNMHFAAFEQMRILNWQQMQYKLYMDQLYAYMNKQKRVSSKLKQSHNRRGRSKRTIYDRSYNEDTTTESMMSSEKEGFTELETSSVETAVDSVEHTKEQLAPFYSAKRGPHFYDMGRKNIGRKPLGCVARFSANGKFVFTDNLNAEKSQIFFASKVDPQPKVLTSFPGPLGRDRTHKLAVKEYLLKRLDEVSLSANKDLMTVINYLVLLVKQNGAICGTDISEILLSEKSEETHDLEVDGSGMNVPEVSLDSSRMTKMNLLASSGSDSQLIQCAAENNSWGMALRFVSLSHNKDLEKQVFENFDKQCHPESTIDPMITFLLIKEKRKFPECFLKNCWRNWREHVAVILSNPTKNQEYDKTCFEVIGDALAAKGFDIPAQFCYILACLPLSFPWEPSARFVLLGSSAKSSFDMMNDYDGMLLTLIFEYAVHLGNQEVCFPSLQFFKLQLSKKMVECGMKSKAIEYCLDTCDEVLANHIHFPSSFLNELRNLTYQFSRGRSEQDEDAFTFFLDQFDVLMDSRSGENFANASSHHSHHSSNSNIIYDEQVSEAFPPKTPAPNLNTLKLSEPLASLIENISDSITLEPTNTEVVDSPINTIQLPFNIPEPPVTQPPAPTISSNLTSKSNDHQSSFNERQQFGATSLETALPVLEPRPPEVHGSLKSPIPIDAPYNVDLRNQEIYTQPIPDQNEAAYQPKFPLFISNPSSQNFDTEPPPPVSSKLKPLTLRKSNSSLNETDGHPGFGPRCKRDKSFRDSICSEASETSIFELSGGRGKQTGYSKAMHRAAERTQSVNSIDSCKSLKYNTVIPETKDETGESNASRNETPVNEPKKTASKTSKKTETKKESTSWIFHGMKTVLTKFIPLPGNQMHLPDDRSSDFYWDPEKKKWVDKTNNGKEEEVPLPPPAAAMMGNVLPGKVPVVPTAFSPLQENGISSSTTADVPPGGPEKPPQPLGNPFARGKNLMINKYVDVLATSNQISSSSVPQLPPMLPPNNFPILCDENTVR